MIALYHLIVKKAIFFGAMVIFLGISILLSRWVIKPVATAWNQQRQFVADASHELKTPLAIIMANAELMQEEEPADSSKQKYASNILSTTYQMRSLVVTITMNGNGEITNVLVSSRSSFGGGRRSAG